MPVRSMLAILVLIVGISVCIPAPLCAQEDGRASAAANPDATKKVDATQNVDAAKSADATKSTGATNNPDATKNKRERAQEAMALTPAREQAALEFIQNHHPELLEVLDQLKAKWPRRYQTVVLDLFRNSERLASMREADPKRHELALRAWKVRSRIHLLGARAALSDDESIRAELRQALVEQSDVRRAQLQYEHDAAADRLKKADAALARFEEERADQIERQYNMLLRQIEKSGEKAKALKQKKAVTDRKAKATKPVAD